MQAIDYEIQMEPLLWKDAYSVGNSQIDRQHKILLSLTNDLLAGIKKGKDFQIISDILSGLVGYAQTHFTDEEVILKHSKYPGYESQMASHEKFVIEINNITEKYKKGVLDSLQLLEFLRKWWLEHILKEDKQYEPYILDIVEIEIDEAESVYSDILSAGVKKINLSNKKLRQLKETAKLFSGAKEKIIANWQAEEANNYRKFPVLREGMEILLDDFIHCFLQGDLTKYLDRNEIMGKHVAAQDIPYHIFMNSFHHWEDAYQKVLEQKFGEDFQAVLSTLDSLHHATISILANQYFNLRDATIYALAKLAESRDPETGNHLLRTREYCAVIAKEVGCSDEFVSYMYQMSPLHDIGKVGISDKILLKAGKLTDEEFEEIKSHTDIGGKTIKTVIGNYKVTKGYLIIAEEIARYHHEKYDGGGYKGLKGRQIPLSARIFAIADIYDALTSKRCYKEPFSHERACSIILQGDGRTKPEDFDPKVLTAFKRRKEDFRKISERFKD